MDTFHTCANFSEEATTKAIRLGQVNEEKDQPHIINNSKRANHE